MNRAGEIYSKLIMDEHNRLVLAVDFDKMQKIIDNLQQRIDKAINHIETHQLCYQSQYEEMSGFDNHLLDILKGEDNENN